MKLSFKLSEVVASCLLNLFLEKKRGWSGVDGTRFSWGVSEKRQCVDSLLTSTLRDDFCPKKQD